MRKVVINQCYGGATLSDKAVNLLGWTENYTGWDREDPEIVKVVEILGVEASGYGADLTVEEVSGPYRIRDYDGMETIIRL